MENTKALLVNAYWEMTGKHGMAPLSRHGRLRVAIPWNERLTFGHRTSSFPESFLGKGVDIALPYNCPLPLSSLGRMEQRPAKHSRP